MSNSGVLAVFSRIFHSHATQAEKHPHARITFRSKNSWKSVADALEQGKRPKIYFAVAGQDDEAQADNNVVYVGTIVEVQLNPSLDDPHTQTLLEYGLKSTSNEALWDDKVKTLYVVTDLAKLLKPFPMTELVRLNADQVIDENYQRLYCLVHER